MKIIANGQLLDTLRRIRSFGLQLVRIDVRQESTRHTEAIAELTQYLGLGLLAVVRRGKTTVLAGRTTIFTPTYPTRLAAECRNTGSV